jgi:hypothetical protein
VSDQHPFATWLVDRHSKDDTPLGDFARDMRDGLDLPASGDGATLRHHLDYNGCDEWALAAFDVAWAMYQPNCSRQGCISAPASGTSLCERHALADLL